MLTARGFVCVGWGLLLLALVAKGQSTPDLNVIGSIGKQQRVLQGQNDAVLFEHVGAGCLSHFWFGGDFRDVENTRIRYYIDGEASPSIDLRLFMGHGIGFHDNHAPWATKWIGKIGKQNGIYNNYQIPFSKNIRVTAQRSPEADENAEIWWIIRGTENGTVSLAGRQLPLGTRFRLHKVEDRIVQPLQELDLMDAEGAGAVLQVFIAAESTEKDRFTLLEGCMRAYRADDRDPVMLSSGLEDYFLGTYYFNTGRYYADTAGLTHFDEPAKRFSAYRFHDVDPLFFSNGLRLTCRNGETKHATPTGPVAAGDPPVTCYTTYTWCYHW